MIDLDRHNAFSLALAAAVLFALPGGCASTRLEPEIAYFPPPPAAPHVVHLKSFNRLNQVARAESNWSSLLGGAPLSPYAGIASGIAYHRGHLYICDSETNTVHDWDLDTGKAHGLPPAGLAGDPQLVKPVAVAVDDGGRVYVADTERGEVVVFNAEGAYVRSLRPAKPDGYRPVALAAYGSEIYVADVGSHQIDIYAVRDGRLMDTFGGIGSDPGRFYFPMGLATDAQGNVFVSDMMNGRVQMFDRERRHVRTIGQHGDRYGDLGKPKRLAVGPDGTIFVADPEFAHVHLFNDQGQFLMLLGSPDDAGARILSRTTSMPIDVAIAPSIPPEPASLVPQDFQADYFLFVSNGMGRRRISLYAVGTARD